MRPISLISLFLSCVSSLVVQPLITPAPQLAIRDTSNICGYYPLLGLTETISCDFGTPCLIATNLSPAIGYCSNPDNAPVTSIYPYGDWPSNQGCGPGEACCPLLTPAVGRYLLNGGSTVFLGCGSTSFNYNAYFATPIPSLVSAATPTSTRARTTSAPNFGLTTGNPQDSTATPTAPRPTQTSTSSGSSGSTTLIVVVVAAVVALISGTIFLCFLYKAVKHYVDSKHRHQSPYPYAYSPSPNNSTTEVEKKKSQLSMWSKIVTIISPIFAIAGVAVSVYFGLRQK